MNDFQFGRNSFDGCVLVSKMIKFWMIVIVIVTASLIFPIRFSCKNSKSPQASVRGCAASRSTLDNTENISFFLRRCLDMNNHSRQ